MKKAPRLPRRDSSSSPLPAARAPHRVDRVGRGPHRHRFLVDRDRQLPRDRRAGSVGRDGHPLPSRTAGRPMAHANSRPGKIVCVGRNYALPRRGAGQRTVPSEPLIFLKPPSAVIAAGEPVRMPPDVGRVDYEGEIGLVVGRRCRRVSEAARVGSPERCRRGQRRDRAHPAAEGTVSGPGPRGWIPSAPVGNVVEASSVDPATLTVTTRVNGDVRQHGTTGEMVFSISRLVSFISHVMTLEAGDLIATGTPEGVGPVAPGDVVEVALSCGSSVRKPRRRRRGARAGWIGQTAGTVPQKPG